MPHTRSTAPDLSKHQRLKRVPRGDTRQVPDPVSGRNVTGSIHSNFQLDAHPSEQRNHHMFEMIKRRGEVLKKAAAQLDGDWRRTEREHRQQRKGQRRRRSGGTDVPGVLRLYFRPAGAKDQFARSLLKPLAAPIYHLPD